MSDMYSSASIHQRDNERSYRKPLPLIDRWNKPFWDATREGILMFQQDTHGRSWFPPSPLSPFDRSTNWSWQPASGKGTVVSWVVFHQKYFAGFSDAIPYNVAMIRLDEGPLIYSNIIDLAPTDIAIGMEVSVRFEEMDGNLRLPVFALIQKEAP